MYEELKFLHVIAVVLLGGTVLVDSMTGITMPRLSTVSELRVVTRLSRVNNVVAWVAMVAIPLFGYATAGDGDWDLGSSWLLWSQVLFWIAVAVSLVALTPGALRLASKVEKLPEGPIPDDVMAEMRNPIFPALGGLLTVFFVVIVYLMVAKPGL